jgi:hypothetical protein
MPAEDKFGLLFNDIPELEFPEGRINSTSAGWSTESIRAIWPTIDDTLLNSLSKKKFCPDECAVRPSLSQRIAELCSAILTAFWYSFREFGMLWGLVFYLAMAFGLVWSTTRDGGVGELIRELVPEMRETPAM